MTTPAASTKYLSRIIDSIRLWEGDAPGALGRRPQDVPMLTAFPANPDLANGATMLVLPGGAYTMLAEHEGRGYAEWFAEHGITAYVLSYRLGSSGYRHPIPLGDAARALRMIRMFAQRDGLDPTRVGVIGSSAGGHLASTLATYFDPGDPGHIDPIERESSKPDLAILCYPVITLGRYTHFGSRGNLFGECPSPVQIQDLSNELQVTKDTSPSFLWHSVEDNEVPVENSLLFANALRKVGVPFSLHIYEKGQHGLGLGLPDRPAPPWARQLWHWLGERNFCPPDCALPMTHAD